jgi:CRP/FNR family transcriptional regulator, cyclic AMP receptor protein
MAAMHDMLALSASLPAVEFAPGEIVVEEGGSSGALWILVSGALRVRKGAVVVNTVTRPGALIGEIALLLEGVNGATVEATEASVLRHAPDGKALLGSDPRISRLVAIGLAERLNVVTTYLADLKQQYGEAPGLSMVNDVLARIAQGQGGAARPGSARDPNPEY